MNDNRISLSGQDRPVLLYHIVATGTMDERVIDHGRQEQRTDP